jgi:hypothetical protein
VRWERSSSSGRAGVSELLFGLTNATGERTYHLLAERLRFLVYPGGEMRGPLLLDGS